MAIRCLCAAIEARLFTFRKMAEKDALVTGVTFDPKEIEILTEQRITVTNGVQMNKPRFLPFSDSVKESLRLFAKAAGVTAKIDCGGVGYMALCRTFEVRNRLMHPKTPFDVEVNVRDIDAANQGIEWFNQECSRVIDECQAHCNQSFQKAIQALQTAAADKSAICLENDTIGAALLAHLNGAQSFTGTAAELALHIIAADKDLDGKLSAKRLGKRLSTLWPHLQKALPVCQRETNRNGVTVFTFKGGGASFAGFQPDTPQNP